MAKLAVVLHNLVHRGVNRQSGATSKYRRHQGASAAKPSAAPETDRNCSQIEHNARGPALHSLLRSILTRYHRVTVSPCAAT